ncbi:hypothetical protein SESBI_13992 [Sesbania bispinosa]|nr:hypothetical protein SESBI_13992 [Sesbania bispinosa]
MIKLTHPGLSFNLRPLSRSRYLSQEQAFAKPSSVESETKANRETVNSREMMVNNTLGLVAATSSGDTGR